MIPDSDCQEGQPKEIELTVVRPEPKHGRAGRPVRLTKRKFIAICHHIEHGHSVTRSCAAEGVTYQILRFRISRSQRLQERYREAEAIRDQVWREAALEAVTNAFAKTWLSAITYLERRYPAEFALRKVERNAEEPPPSEPSVRVIGLPQNELDKLTGPEYKRLESGNIAREIGGVKVIYARLAT